MKLTLTPAQRAMRRDIARDLRVSRIEFKRGKSAREVFPDLNPTEYAQRVKSKTVIAPFHYAHPAQPSDDRAVTSVSEWNYKRTPRVCGKR